MKLFARDTGAWDTEVDTITERIGGNVLIAPRPPLTSKKPEPSNAAPAAKTHLEEYAELAGIVGVMPPDLAIESFKTFLLEHDITVFSLSEVVAYMDAKAAVESKERAGWEWRPLRAKDNKYVGLKFGRQAQAENHNYSPPRKLVPGSDYYMGPYEYRFQHPQTGQAAVAVQDGAARVYDKTIPLHALRKVALIERAHTGTVAFFVADYALAPAIIYPDPFLMAVVPNPNADTGTGRFVIDFWDEPGFGLDKQLA